MAQYETNRNTVTELGRGSTQTEVHSSGSQSTTAGAQTVTKTDANPEVAVVQAVAAPEQAVVRSGAVHVGVMCKFTLSFRDRT